MLTARYDGESIRIERQSDGPCIAFVKACRADGSIELLTVRFPQSRQSARLEVGKASEFELAALVLPSLEMVVCKKLSQGQHDSPPKGYPTSREDYAVPEDYEFPIDRKHIHAAISYFNKHKWKSSEHKRRAARRILSRAKKYGVKVSKDSDVYRAAHGD